MFPSSRAKKNIYSRRSQHLAPQPRRRRARRSRQTRRTKRCGSGSFHPRKLRTKPKKSKSDSNPARRFRQRFETRPLDLLNTLNEIAAKHGIGRTDLVENRLVGKKSRGAYETPGGTLLVKAHQRIGEASPSIARPRISSKALSLRYAELVYYGLWFAPLREALDGFFNVAQQRVTAPSASNCGRAPSTLRNALRLFRFTAPTSPVSPWAATTPKTPKALSIFSRCR